MSSAGLINGTAAAIVLEKFSIVSVLYAEAELFRIFDEVLPRVGLGKTLFSAFS